MLATTSLATWYDVHRLTTVQDWADRPLTGNANGTSQLGWVDGAVGVGGQATEVPYHVSSDYLVNLRFWRDLEFWNKAVRFDAQHPAPGPYVYTGGTFPKTSLVFDPVTGRSSVSPTRWAVQSVTESRFQLAGTVVGVQDGAMLIDAGKRWRLAWSTTGPYDDGWMKPNGRASIRVYPGPGQVRPRLRLLSLQVGAPADVSRRPFTVRSNETTQEYAVENGATVHVDGFPVCVPPGRPATVEVSATGSSTIPGDLGGSYEDSLGTRTGSVYLADTSVSDNVGDVCSP